MDTVDARCGPEQHTAADHNLEKNSKTVAPIASVRSPKIYWLLSDSNHYTKRTGEVNYDY